MKCRTRGFEEASCGGDGDDIDFFEDDGSVPIGRYVDRGAERRVMAATVVAGRPRYFLHFVP